MKHLLEDLDILGFGKTKFVMDRGFYSEDNINGLYREHVKFLVGVKLSLKFIKKNLDKVYDDIRMFTNYDESINTYGYTVSAEWDYSQERPYKGDVIKDKRRIYIHYYYSIEKGADDEQAFDKRITELCSELQEGKLVEEHKKAYAQFFVVNRSSTYGSILYFKELRISLLVFLNELAFLQFGTQLGDALVKSLLVISIFFDAVIVMDVDPAFILDCELFR